MNHLIIIFFIIIQIIYSSPNEKAKRTLQSEKSNDIIILHTNDVHCGVQDTIGYDGLMLYKKQLLNKYNNVMLVDAGDHIQGGTFGLLTQGETIIDLMNKMEYEVVTLGNHEFDYGIDQLTILGKSLNSGYISSNYCYKKNKTSIYPPYKIVEKGGKKIGFIGVATPQTLSKTYLITVLDENGELVYDFLTENHSQELYDRVQQHIDELKKENVDLIIILGHLGMYGDALEENSSAGVLKNLKSINTFVDGHSHKVYSMTAPDEDGKNVILVQTGTKLSNIGVLTIHENGTLSHFNLDEVPYDPALANETVNVTRSKVVRHVDKDMYEYINDFYDSFSPLLDRVIGKSDFLLNVFKNASESTESHTQLSRSRENALCNLVTDAMRDLGEADITIMNAGSVRTDINEGNITYQHVINTMPFSNDVLVKKITGQAILEALDFGVRTLPGVTSRFPQVSGITFKVDTSIDSTVEVDENEVFVKLGDKQRVYDIKVNGEKLDLNKNYTISSNSFILGGGDGYSMFTDCEIVKTAVGVDNEVLLKYIQDNLNGSIPYKYKASEGRMIITDGKIYDNISLSLLGFDNVTITPQLITFNEYLVSLEKINFEFPKQLYLKTTLNKKARLRILQETEKDAQCLIQNEVNETSAKYLCEIPNDNSNFNSIKAQKPNMTNFDVKISPLVNEYVYNSEGAQNSGESSVLNREDYVLQDTAFARNGSKLVIYGNIDGEPSFSKNNLTLITSQLPENNKKNLSCTIENEASNKYNLLCEVDPNGEYNLDNSVLIDNDKILITNFGGDSGITKVNSNATYPSSNPTNPDSSPSSNPNEENSDGNRWRYVKKSSGLKGGYIALIVIIPVVVIALVAVLIILLRKSSSNQHESLPDTSTIHNIKAY